MKNKKKSDRYAYKQKICDNRIGSLKHPANMKKGLVHKIQPGNTVIINAYDQSNRLIESTKQNIVVYKETAFRLIVTAAYA
jgi:hypothetical protein